MTKPLAQSPVLRSLGLMAMAAALSAGTARGDEFDLDLGVAGSDLSTGWGAGVHAQWLFENNLGLDLGYRYLSNLEYETDGGTAGHRFSQYETGLIWQEGNAGARFQAIAGMIFAGYAVDDANGDEILARFTPGYRIDADISVPLFTRFRLFANGGYQGFYSDGMPDHWRWRYGIRMTFGNEVSPLERDQQARMARRQAEIDAARTDPPVQIDPDVPRYMPRHLSQSLPPIVELSELCKCFPEGPYTIQLGEFRSMEQAVRAMEFRGLRQFFNTVAYERDPQPVFLARTGPDAPVMLFVGEYEQLTRTDYWRRQLRRNGIEGRLRRVVEADGPTPSRTVAVPEHNVSAGPEYSPEEVARMNSLPAQSNSAGRRSMNRVPEDSESLPHSLVVGPVTESTVRAWLEDENYRDALLVSSRTAIPGRHRLVWDATRARGWLYLDRFPGDDQLDQWRAWLEEQGLVPDVREEAPLPVGDIYVYTLGGELHGHNVELDRQAGAGDILARMVSPEVLWFQAYQAINGQPPELVVNWSGSDARYHLVATGFARRGDARSAWQSLSGVGLLPSLVE